MPILITLGAVLLLLALIIGLRWHPFLALLLVAILAGLSLGMPADAVFATLKEGIGGTLGGIAVILGLGAVLGGVIAETGAAHVISSRLIGDGSNPHRAVWMMGLVAFLIGIPLFYNAAFVLLAPIVFAVATRAKLPLGMVAVAGVAALSVTHGFLPPHPAPVFISGEYGADIGKVLLYGMLLAVPAVIIAGPLFSNLFLKHMPLTAADSA
ncbi:MAG: SLC13 family permease, partial [Bacteroidota bacterium]